MSVSPSAGLSVEEGVAIVEASGDLPLIFDWLDKSKRTLCMGKAPEWLNHLRCQFPSVPLRQRLELPNGPCPQTETEKKWGFSLCYALFQHWHECGLIAWDPKRGVIEVKMPISDSLKGSPLKLSQDAQINQQTILPITDFADATRNVHNIVEIVMQDETNRGTLLSFVDVLVKQNLEMEKPVVWTFTDLAIRLVRFPVKEVQVKYSLPASLIEMNEQYVEARIKKRQ